MPGTSVFGSVVSVFGSTGDFKVGRKVSTASAVYKPLATSVAREALSYDDVLPHLGGFGSYQRRIYFLLCLPIVLCGFHKLSGVFTQAKTSHRCELPWEQEVSNSSYPLSEHDLKMCYPWEDGEKAWSSCRLLDADYTPEYLASDVPANESVACSSWVYDTSKYVTTTMTEFNLVCDDTWKRALADTAFMIGELIGSFTFGDLSDRFGRRPIFFIALVMQVVGGFLATVAPEHISYMLARMIIGSTIPGVSLVAYVIGMEMVGPDKRVFAGVVCQYFFSTGYVLTFAFAYFIKEWRTLQLALTIPGLVFLSYWWFIPESARWLMMKGRTQEARALFVKTAKVNKVTIPSHILNNLANKQNTGSQQESVSVFDLFRYPNLRIKTLNLFFSWFVNNAAYYGLSWNTSNLGGNEHLNFVLSGLVEIPAYTLLILTLNRWGRKSLLCASMLIGGLTLLATIAVPPDVAWLNITLYMFGKLAVTASYGTIYLFSVEQFPTVIRNVGLGACSTLARVGGITAPSINLLANYWLPLPQIVFGSLIFSGGLLALFLPETLNKQLPDTIAEGEAFGKKPQKNNTEVGMPKSKSEVFANGPTEMDNLNSKV